MAIQFHPLPVSAFPVAAQPSIRRLNFELRDLFGLEGALNEPRGVRRSDRTVARRDFTQVDVSRITPDIMNTVSGVSSVLGVPNLTFSTVNAVGTTSSVLSANSTIKMFDATAPADSDAGAAVVGVVALSARRDHKHLITTAVPSFVFGTSATIGSAASLVRSDATLAIFDATAPAVLAAAASHGSTGFAADAGHVHEWPTSLQSDANSFTLALTDNGTDGTLTLSSGVLNIPNDVDIATRMSVGPTIAPSTAFELRANGSVTDGTTNHGSLQFGLSLAVVSGAFGADFDGATGLVTNNSSSINATGKWSGFKGGIATASSVSLADTACFRSQTSFIELFSSPTLTSHVNFLSAPPTVQVFFAGVSTITTGYGFRHKGWAAANLTVGTGYSFYADADPALFTAIGAAIVAKTGAYTMTDDDYTVTCDATSAAFTITLPATSGRTGRIYHIKKTDASGNAVTVDGNASETIDGATTAALAAQYDSIMIISDGSNWHII